MWLHLTDSSVLSSCNRPRDVPPFRARTKVPRLEVEATNSTPGSIKVVLLKSYGETSGWHELKTEWPKYGSKPIVIDDRTFLFRDFTYQDLVDSGADVIVLSDPAGGLQVYSQDEIDAVAQYASTGHVVLGTFVVFQWYQTDNRGLAPIFGLSSQIAYNTFAVSLSNLFKKVGEDQCLFSGLSGGYWRSKGYPSTQRPISLLPWPAALAGASIAAESDVFNGIVSTFNGGTYTAIYISNFPEYRGGVNDKQLLYNAVTCYVTQ